MSEPVCLRREVDRGLARGNQPAFRRTSPARESPVMANSATTTPRQIARSRSAGPQWFVEHSSKGRLAVGVLASRCQTASSHRRGCLPRVPPARIRPLVVVSHQQHDFTRHFGEFQQHRPLRVHPAPGSGTGGVCSRAASAQQFHRHRDLGGHAFTIMGSDRWVMSHNNASAPHVVRNDRRRVYPQWRRGSTPAAATTCRFSGVWLAKKGEPSPAGSLRRVRPGRRSACADFARRLACCSHLSGGRSSGCLPTASQSPAMKTWQHQDRSRKPDNRLTKSRCCLCSFRSSSAGLSAVPNRTLISTCNVVAGLPSGPAQQRRSEDRSTRANRILVAPGSLGRARQLFAPTLTNQQHGNRGEAGPRRIRFCYA